VPVTAFAIGYLRGYPIDRYEVVGALLVVGALIANAAVARGPQPAAAPAAPPRRAAGLRGVARPSGVPG
jgi:hypothetical protein